MLLICPSCSTHYEVAPDRIPSDGRSVKCASCDHVWNAGAAPQAASASSGPRNGSESHVTGRTPFSRPLSTARGGAALAALFDHHDLAEEEQIIEGKCEPVSNVRALVTIDQQLEEALGSGQIARLIEQQKSGEAVASPFHDELSALKQENPALESLLQNSQQASFRPDQGGGASAWAAFRCRGRSGCCHQQNRGALRHAYCRALF